MLCGSFFYFPVDAGGLFLGFSRRRLRKGFFKRVLLSVCNSGDLFWHDCDCFDGTAIFDLSADSGRIPH